LEDEDSGRLLLIDIVNAHGVVILQTIWAPVDQLRLGWRLTRTESIADQAQLMGRLAELVPLIAGRLPATTAAAASCMIPRKENGGYLGRGGNPCP